MDARDKRRMAYDDAIPVTTPISTGTDSRPSHSDVFVRGERRRNALVPSKRSVTTRVLTVTVAAIAPEARDAARASPGLRLAVPPEASKR
ncbi:MULTISPECIES: hypothetical protein [unclassified Microbacterium]|uniref:hypothetical protein n=1 Tax=unclassified Microbacterium TaxID=2609290 RepID=UPI00111BF04A|nr:hypothetical protein [Microbacterium sp. LEMMJ01]